MIKKEDLEIGGIYEVGSIHYKVAVWTGSVFRGPGVVDDKYRIIESHHYDEPYPKGVTTPVRKIGSLNTKAPFDGGNFLVLLVALEEEI